MSLAVFENVSLNFGQKTIVDDLNLRIGNADRIGLIGPNGSGKTSLMRILASEQSPDGGTVRTASGVRLGYLPQDIQLEGHHELLGFVRDSVPGRAALDTELAACEAELARLEAKPQDDAVAESMMDCAERLAELHERVTHYDVHFTEHEAMRILSGLGFTPEDYTRKLSELSGGWKMRAVLAGLLFQQPDLLLLDEPTNHLDMPSVTWFSDFLKQYKHAFILICHDREFLNEQIDRIVSFELEGVRQYGGNYEKYLKQRAEEEIILENKAKNLEREREQAERFINRFRAQANKARAVQSRVKALEKMESVERYAKRAVMRFQFPPSGRTSNEPIKIHGLRKAYGEHRVLDGVDLAVKRGERIGIIGVNGAGKTTLLRMLAGEIEASAGEIEYGHNVKAGYYAQHHADKLHKDSTLFSEVSQEDPDASITRVRTILGSFLFSGDDVDKKVGVLSGGERARVALAKLLVNPGNLLMMDEPTNHLDLASSEALSESLSTYDGTLIFVSHNRAFVRKLATRIWNVEGGTVEVYPGTLDEYMDACRRRAEEAAGAESAAKPSGSAAASAGRAATAADLAVPEAATATGGTAAPARKRGTRAEEKERKRREAMARQGGQPGGDAAKQSSKGGKGNKGNQAGKGNKGNQAGKGKRSGGADLRRQVSELEGQIAALEDAQKERSALLSDPVFYADTTKSADVVRAYGDAKEELEGLTERWMEAQAALEHG